MKTNPLNALAPKEREVAELIGEGLNNADIASRMGVGEQTIKNYSSAVIKKLGLKNRTEVALLITAAYMLPIIDEALREFPELAADRAAVQELAKFREGVVRRFPQCQ
jgi:DNA-binding CsgD family transcriptional regulator